MRWCRAWSSWEDWFQHIPWNIYWFQHLPDCLPQVRQPCRGFSGTVTCRVVMVKCNLYPLNCQRLYRLPANEGAIAWVIPTVNEDFPDGPVVKNLPCNAGDTDSFLVQGDPTCHSWLSPGPTATEPVVQSPRAAATEVCVPQNPGSATRQATTMRRPCTAARESPHTAKKTQHSQKVINK